MTDADRLAVALADLPAEAMAPHQRKYFSNR